MLNHKYPEESEWLYDNKRKGVVLQALVNIPKGHEVTTCYVETYTNAQIFSGYGFIEDHGKNDTLLVRLNIFQDDPLYLEKRNWINLLDYEEASEEAY